MDPAQQKFTREVKTVKQSKARSEVAAFIEQLDAVGGMGDTPLGGASRMLLSNSEKKGSITSKERESCEHAMAASQFLTLKGLVLLQPLDPVGVSADKQEG